MATYQITRKSSGMAMGQHEGETLDVGARVEAGEGEDHDTGRVLAVDGEQVTVAWDSGVRTTQHVSLLRVQA